METIAKVGIGIGIASLVGVGIYFGFIRKAKTAVGSSGGAGSAPAGAAAAPATIDERITKAKKQVKEVGCNKKFPPPRTKKSKIEEYKACMAGADGYTWNTPLNS